MVTGRLRPNRWCALLPALLAALLVTGCQPIPREPRRLTPQAAGARATPPPTLERLLVVDTPRQSRSPGRAGDEAAAHDPARPDPAPAAPTHTGSAPSPSVSPPSQPTVPAMNLPSDSAPTPESAGNVVLLAPVPCGVLAVRVARARPDPAGDDAVPAPELAVCDPPTLPSGAADGQVFVALLTFDLRALPASSELLYAGLELAGLDDALLGEVGGWTVRAVELPADTALEALSFSRIMAVPAARPAIGWQLGRAELAPGGRNTLRIGADGLDHLAGQLGQGVATFRIEGPLDGTNLFKWEGQGPRAPRLRLAYMPGVPTPATARPLIVWDGAPTAGATPAAPTASPIGGTPGS